MKVFGGDAAETSSKKKKNKRDVGLHLRLREALGHAAGVALAHAEGGDGKGPGGRAGDLGDALAEHVG